MVGGADSHRFKVVSRRYLHGTTILTTDRRVGRDRRATPPSPSGSSSGSGTTGPGCRSTAVRGRSARLQQLRNGLRGSGYVRGNQTPRTFGSPMFARTWPGSRLKNVDVLDHLEHRQQHGPRRRARRQQRLRNGAVDSRYATPSPIQRGGASGGRSNRNDNVCPGSRRADIPPRAYPGQGKPRRGRLAKFPRSHVRNIRSSWPRPVTKPGLLDLARLVDADDRLRGRVG